MRMCPPPPLGTILAESIAIAVASNKRLFVIRLDPNQCETKALGNMSVIWRRLPVGVALPFHSFPSFPLLSTLLSFPLFSLLFTPSERRTARGDDSDRVRLIQVESTTNLLGLSREPAPFGGSCPMRYVSVAALDFACLVARPADAQQTVIGTTKNRVVEPIVAEISPARIEATIRMLASFGTRHTLSDPENPDRGISAARWWIKAELEPYATSMRPASHFEATLDDKPTDTVEAIVRRDLQGRPVLRRPGG
jgi:hypothetical protein